MYFGGAGRNGVYSTQLWNPEAPRVEIIQQQVPQQASIIIQELSGLQAPVSHFATVRNGHVKEDLVELMMIQNAQMHQVIMNNITMTALSSFGHSPQSQPATQNIGPLREEVNEPDTIYHHHYEAWPFPAFPSWPRLSAQPETQQPGIRHITSDPSPNAQKDIQAPFRAVPPPPPPSATGTVGADVPPASEYYDVA
ncbi:proline-rich protein 29 [Callorhinchus milii]|uniref:DUF4587 domain-containing protein n=1 Tax=Callorhinchus milii TaxID=7868 RepID=V9L7X2_CALMI|nr:proline-rich protein 29 [Callorhinchus milii]|eukprot:gi/632977784/ref/XP_007905540.1/ PREDICTED: uncharacterized protein C17orf72 homolog isoform X2 [Callorhinchus milii]